MSLINFKADPELIAKADAAAKAEGLSRSDIARRALMRDLAARTVTPQDKAA